jgi:hypothetical protein
MEILEHFGEDAHGRDGHDYAHGLKSKETLSNVWKRRNYYLFLLLLIHEVSRLVTTPGDFDVSLSAKNRCLFKF